MRAALLRLPVLLLLVAFAGCAAPASGPQVGGEALPPDPVGTFTELPEAPVGAASSAFWAHWGDGQAELASYRTTISRYGEERPAEAVLIYVTEPMDRRTWIKDDEVQGADRVNVLKLNYSLKFLTGIYPYSVMTSVFAPVDDWGRGAFAPVKIGLSVQEWCGMVMHQVWPGPDAMLSRLISYFADEGETTEVVPVPEGEVLYEDALFIHLRELDGPFAGGTDWEGHVVPTLMSRRFAHLPARPLPATLTRTDTTYAGQAATQFTLRFAEGYGRDDGAQTRTFFVAQEAPRYLLGWTTSWGETAELVATERVPYWQLNGEGDERYRTPLGLETEGYRVTSGGSDD